MRNKSLQFRNHRRRFGIVPKSAAITGVSQPSPVNVSNSRSRARSRLRPPKPRFSPGEDSHYSPRPVRPGEEPSADWAEPGDFQSAEPRWRAFRRDEDHTWPNESAYRGPLRDRRPLRRRRQERTRRLLRRRGRCEAVRPESPKPPRQGHSPGRRRNAQVNRNHRRGGRQEITRKIKRKPYIEKLRVTLRLKSTAG